MKFLLAKSAILGLASFSLLVLPTKAWSVEEHAAPYYRSPAIAGSEVVFTAEGDLWLSDLSSKEAKRLTTHAAEESQALLTPDGKQVVYIAQYDGSTDIYSLGRSGGQAKRLTALNAKVKLHGFHPSGELLYSTDANIGPVNSWGLRLLDLATGLSRELPLKDAVEGAIDAEGKFIYFIRYGLQLTGDNAKQYQGGAKGQLWRWSLNSAQEAERLLAEHTGSLRHPVWLKDTLYVVSDASGMPNIWAYQPQTGSLSAHTDHQDYAVRSLRGSSDALVYQHGADVRVLSDGENRIFQPTLVTDSPAKRERLIARPLRYLTSHDVNAEAEKLVLTVRAKVLVLSKAPKRIVELAVPETARARAAVLSPKGDFVYLLSDQSGEIQLWRYASDGSDAGQQLTHDLVGFRWQLSVSPNGRYIAHDDKAGRLFLYDTKTGKNTQIYTKASGLTPYSDLTWHPESSALAFSVTLSGNPRQQLALYSLDEQKSQVLTKTSYDSHSPAFSPNGQWLYFLSDRHLQATPGSPWGDRIMGAAFDKRSLVFAFGLTSNTQFPFEAESELNQKSAVASSPLKVSELGKMLWQVPVSAGQYVKIQVAQKQLYLMSGAPWNAGGVVHSLEIAPANAQGRAELKEYSKAVRDVKVTADGKKITLIRQSANGQLSVALGVSGAKAPESAGQEFFALSKLALRVTPKAEWQQMYQDAWLMHREFLFDPAMRGTDWSQLKQHYLPLLERVRDRYELDDVLAQLVGELSALHSQVRGGDYGSFQAEGRGASLGGRWQETEKGLVLATLYKTDADLPWLQSPLAKGVDPLQEGDLLIAVNHQAVPSQVALQDALQQQQGQQVLLTVERKGKQVQKIVVPQSQAQESVWRYQHWVTQNKNTVEEQSQGRFGYLHLYAMTSSDLAQFARDFYAQVEKEGLIIDVRRNRGGNIDSFIIEKLLRRVWSFWQPQQGDSYGNMQQTFRGRLVVLADELTYSDGETFTAGVKALGLGPVIGQQTSGAGVWLSGRNLLSDFGVARVAETAQFDNQGRYIIEGRGVSPDIAVVNLPYASFQGADAQLQVALSQLETLLKALPVSKLNAEVLQPGPANDVKRM